MWRPVQKAGGRKTLSCPLSQRPCGFPWPPWLSPGIWGRKALSVAAVWVGLEEAPVKGAALAAMVSRQVTSNPSARNSKRRADRRGHEPRIPG